MCGGDSPPPPPPPPIKVLKKKLIGKERKAKEREEEGGCAWRRGCWVSSWEEERWWLGQFVGGRKERKKRKDQDSLLGLMQVNTSFGPMYFTCYPKLELDRMNDQSIHKSLTLNVQTQNYDMDPRSRNILIVYRVYYKVMTYVVNPNCLLSSPRDQTLI